jgi:arginase family enzyme
MTRSASITLDAHFDMRDLDSGLSNGNPVRALLEDGLPGANIAQVGLASFANSRAMHEDAVEAGSSPSPSAMSAATASSMRSTGRSTMCRIATRW